MRHHPLRSLIPLVLATLLLAGCLKPLVTVPSVGQAQPGRSVSATSAVAPLVGQVEHYTYRVQGSTIADIAVGSTVSIIDTTTNQTLNTTVTDDKGAFSIKFSPSFQPSNQIYYLEAYKGLPIGGTPNRAGNSMARVRTLVQYQNGLWRHLHDSEQIKISVSSTTLAVITSLRAASDSTRVDPLTLLGTLGPAIPEFNGAGGVTAPEFQTVRDQVVQCLAGDQDPLYRITYDLDGRNFFLIDRGISISRVDPLSGPMGTRVSIEGTNLGVAPIVRFNGTVASSSVNAVSTVIQADVPIGATSGPVTVQVGTIVFNGANFAVAPWDGHNVFDAAGNMYVGSRRDDRIYRFDPSGNLSLYVASALLDDPRSLVVTDDGTLYVACFNSDTIVKVAPDKTVSVHASGVDGPTSLIRTANGDLFAATYNGTTDRVYRIPNGSTTPETYVSGYPGAWGLAAAPNGEIYMSDYQQGKIYRIKSDRTVEQLAEGLDEPRGLAMDSRGNLYVACYGSHNVYRISPTGGLGIFASMPNYPGWLAMNPNGTLYVGSYLYNFVAQVDATGQVLDYWSPGHLTWAVKAQPGAVNPDLYVSSGMGWGYRTEAVYRMNHNGADYDPPTPLFRDIPNPSAIGVAQNDPNTMYIGDWNGFLFKGNISAGTYTTYAVGVGAVGDVTTDSTGKVYSASWSGHAMHRFTGTSLDRIYGRSWYFNNGIFDGAGNMYVADRWYGKILRITPGGVISVYSDNGGSGFGEANGLAFWNGDLYVGSWDRDRVYRIPSGGGAPVEYLTGIDGAASVAIDGSGNLFVASYYGKYVRVYDSSKVLKATLTLADNPRAVAVDGSGNLFVHAYNEGKVYKYTPITPGVSYNAPTELASGVGNCMQIYLETNGDLLLASYSDRVVYRVPSGGGSPTSIVSLPIRPGGVVRDAAGDLYVMTWDAPNVYKYTGGSTTYRLWASSLRTPAGIHLDEANGVAYVTDWDNYVVNKVDLTTGDISIAANSADWASGVRSLKGITAKDGKLYVNAWGGGVYQLTLSGTTVTSATLWGTNTGSTGVLGGIAFGAGGRLYGSSWDWVNNGNSSYIYHEPTGGAHKDMTNWPNLVGF